MYLSDLFFKETENRGWSSSGLLFAVFSSLAWISWVILYQFVVLRLKDIVPTSTIMAEHGPLEHCWCYSTHLTTYLNTGHTGPDADSHAFIHFPWIMMVKFRYSLYHLFKYSYSWMYQINSPIICYLHPMSTMKHRCSTSPSWNMLVAMDALIDGLVKSLVSSGSSGKVRPSLFEAHILPPPPG